MFECAYCGKKIGDNQSLKAIDVKFHKGFDYSNREGEVVSIYFHTLKRKVPMIVTTADSPAKEQGQDGLFVVCSNLCGKKLQSALRQEIV
ncbi:MULTISPECIES: hypothetical protein [Gracilibacillus]|uniref:hypothetical protein n=1 Tax=Gracilibacillus TaxID=74385 RepID=UPI00082526C5|nr:MULTISPECIES: hypothetical protein [Gracilibacillus]